MDMQTEFSELEFHQIFFREKSDLMYVIDLFPLSFFSSYVNHFYIIAFWLIHSPSLWSIKKFKIFALSSND